MKLATLFLLSLICLSCGGLMQGKATGRRPASVLVKPSPEDIDQRIFLSALKTKYERENKAINLAIVRSMIMELEEKYPMLAGSHDSMTTENLRKRPGFLSLELTIEHLSHRESVKQSTRHSAFHSIP